MDLEREIIGYKTNFELTKNLNNINKYLSKKSNKFLEIYFSEFKKNI